MLKIFTGEAFTYFPIFPKKGCSAEQSMILGGLGKQPFLLAPCGHFTRRNVYDSATEIPY